MNFKECVHIKRTAGTVPEAVSSSNCKEVHYYEYHEDMSRDCFIHVLATAELQFPSPCTLETDLLPCYHLLYIYDGALEISTPPYGLLRGQKNSFMFFSGSSALSLRLRSGNCRLFHAFLTGQPLDRFAHILPQVLSYTDSASSVSRIEDCIRHMCRHAVSQTDTLDLMLAKWANDILTELCLFTTNPAPMSANIPAYMLQMKELLDTTYQQPHSLSQLEDTFDRSRYRLCREFTQYFGDSPIQYLNKKRIEEAKSLLLSTDLTVREVGSMVGIENTTHFINLFKKITGATPLSFKQEAPAAISELHYPYTPDAHPQ